MHTISMLFNELGEKVAASSQRASDIVSIDDLIFHQLDNKQVLSFASLQSRLMKQARIDVSIYFQGDHYIGDVIRMEYTGNTQTVFVVNAKYIAQRAHISTDDSNNIINSTDIAPWEWDISTDIIKINEHWANIQGFALDEISPVTATSWKDSLHPDYTELFNYELQRHFKGETRQFEIEYPIYSKDKDLVWVKDFGQVVARDAQGQPERILGTRLNLTNVKIAQFKLNDLQQQLDNLMDLSPSLTYKMCADADERIQFITQSTEQLLGYDVDDILWQPKWWRQRIAPQDLWEYDRCRDIAKTRLQQPIMDCEYRFINKEGEEVWLIDRVRYVDNGYESPYFIGTILDLSEFVTLNQHFKTLSLLPPGVIYQFQQDKNGHYSFPYASDEFENIFGVPVEEAARDANIPFSMIHEEDLAGIHKEIERSTRTVTESNAEFRITRNNLTRWYFFQAKPAKQKDGSLLWSGQIIDITERKALEQQLEQQAITDDLTGVYNRRFFMEKAHQMLVGCQDSSRPFTLLCIDLDHFKLVNDTYGHFCGDQVLIEAVKKMQSALRSDDILARIGGEEFIIALANVTLDNALDIANRIRRDIRMFTVFCNDTPIFQTVTIGVVESEPDNTLTELMKRGDNALYLGKKSGRDQTMTG